MITPIFIHMNIFHLFFNMTAMRYLGERIEMRKGTWRFALICLVAAIGGNVGQFYLSGGTPSAGCRASSFALAGYLWIKGTPTPTDGLSLERAERELDARLVPAGDHRPADSLIRRPASLRLSL